MKTYYRGTNNPNEETLIRTQQLRNSLNHLTGELERGISVSDVNSVGEYFQYLYKLTGAEVGIGADGEPLLDPTSVKFIKWVVGPDIEMTTRLKRTVGSIKWPCKKPAKGAGNV